MKPVLSAVVVLSAVALGAFFSCATGFEISHHVSSLPKNSELPRAKREMENFDDEFATSPTARGDQQEDVGFWDRIIRVALKLFSHLIQWINS